MNANFIIKELGVCDYNDTWQSMKEFTESRTENTSDEFWCLQHQPVFTLGLAGRTEHILNTNHTIPIIHCDRGGQVTYHGPGQIIVYILVDLKRTHLSIRDLVTRIEDGVIAYLATLDITATGNREAPGVYVGNKKIASMGLKVRKGCTYHGLSFNATMDTTPFNYINVCGYQGLKVTQLQEYIKISSILNISSNLTKFLIASIYK